MNPKNLTFFSYEAHSSFIVLFSPLTKHNLLFDNKFYIQKEASHHEPTRNAKPHHSLLYSCHKIQRDPPIPLFLICFQQPPLWCSNTISLSNNSKTASTRIFSSLLLIRSQLLPGIQIRNLHTNQIRTKHLFRLLMFLCWWYDKSLLFPSVSTVWHCTAYTVPKTVIVLCDHLLKSFQFLP